MSKKAVIVPKWQWAIVEHFANEKDIDHEFKVNFFLTRENARRENSFTKQGSVRKVTKIVYHYE